MEVGEFAEACRALGRVVEERATEVGAESVDEDVLDRLVHAATRAPPNDGGSTVVNPNEGQGLLRRMEDLFGRIILPHVSSGHARLYSCRKSNCPRDWRLTWKATVPASLVRWREARPIWNAGVRV